MEKLQTRRLDIPCDLFSTQRGFIGTGAGKVAPRNATENEVRAYFDWIRRRLDLPDVGAMSLDRIGVAARDGRDKPTKSNCRGATFGTNVNGDWAEGSYSIPMPGYQSAPAVVTMETLDDAGDVLTSSTMPIDPKKGGVIWDRDAVRKAHGPIAKATRARATKTVTPPPVEVIAAPVEEAPQKPVEAIHPSPLPMEQEMPETPPAPACADASELPAHYAMFALIEDMQARLDALEAAREPETESQTAPPAVEAVARPDFMRERRLRLVRRYLAMRKERATLRANARIGQAQYDDVKARLVIETAARERLEFDHDEMHAKLAALELEAREPRAHYGAELDRLTARCVFLENREFERLSGGRIKLNMHAIVPGQTLNAAALAG